MVLLVKSGHVVFVISNYRAGGGGGGQGSVLEAFSSVRQNT